MAALDTLTRDVVAKRDALLDVLAPAPTPRLGLDALELEAILVAIGDLEDRSGPDVRARLARGRAALELELADALAA